MGVDVGCQCTENSPVKWNVELNASFIKDTIKDLYGDNDVRQTSYAKIWTVGGSQYEFYMPTWAGVDAELVIRCGIMSMRMVLVLLQILIARQLLSAKASQLLMFMEVSTIRCHTRTSTSMCR